jgi:hypothetical protein
MAGPNTLFCLRQLPHIGAQLRLLPPKSRDRRELEEAIEAISPESLKGADRIFAIVTGTWRKDANRRS